MLESHKQLVATRLLGSVAAANMQHLGLYFAFHKGLPLLNLQIPSDPNMVIAGLQKLARPLILATVYTEGWQWIIPRVGSGMLRRRRVEIRTSDSCLHC
jgi:hypothetical protein